MVIHTIRFYGVLLFALHSMEIRSLPRLSLAALFVYPSLFQCSHVPEWNPRWRATNELLPRAEINDGPFVQTITMLSPVHVQVFAQQDTAISIYRDLTLQISNAPTFVDTVLTGEHR